MIRPGYPDGRRARPRLARPQPPAPQTGPPSQRRTITHRPWTSRSRWAWPERGHATFPAE